MVPSSFLPWLRWCLLFLATSRRQLAVSSFALAPSVGGRRRALIVSLRALTGDDGAGKINGEDRRVAKAVASRISSGSGSANLERNQDEQSTASSQEEAAKREVTTATTAEVDASSPPEMWMDEQVLTKDSDVSDLQRRNTIINVAAGGLLAAVGVASWDLYRLTVYTPPGYVRLPVTQFIAALGAPGARQGDNAQSWGVWTSDPGPRGVYLNQYETKLAANDNVAPMGWTFDPSDWWVEEHGLIMESPSFPLAPGHYLVTGGRDVTCGLIVQANGHWELEDKDATLFDVTHLPCRSARYQPLPGSSELLQGSPVNANLRDFPVKPGAVMPSIAGTQKQDYAVLFLIGKAV